LRFDPEVFHYENDQLSAAGVPLAEIARSIPTPFYVYDPASALARFRALSRAFIGIAHIHCVALKANSQPALLRPLFAEGAGAEVVSGAELALALALGLSPSRIVISGGGKTDRELASGIAADVLLFLVESETELRALNSLAGEAGRKRVACGSTRIDRDPHIDRARQVRHRSDEVIYRASQYAWFRPAHSHRIPPSWSAAENARALSSLVREIRESGIAIRHVDIGEAWDLTAMTPAFEACRRRRKLSRARGDSLDRARPGALRSGWRSRGASPLRQARSRP
jgi:hypothetical protein